jgi:NAD(P)-dependent dehydrogenase (short-subunit alcohol dehydrogenase family)
MTDTYRCKLLLVGRTSLPDLSLPVHSAPNDALSDRISRYLRLQEAGRDIVYEAADVSDGLSLKDAVKRAEKRWGQRLLGIFHTAGVAAPQGIDAGVDRSLQFESATAIEELARAKVAGAHAAVALLEDTPESLFVAFSSAAGFLGGVGLGAYATAAGLLDEFMRCANSNSRYRRVYNLIWSLWGDTGMSADLSQQELKLSRSAGFLPISPQQAIHSLEIVLSASPGEWIIGLDSGNSRVMRLMADTPSANIFEGFCASSSEDEEGQLPDIELFDRFGTKLVCRAISKKSWPSGDGTLDLAALVNGTSGRLHSKTMPQTELQSKLMTIWSSILNRSEIGIDDSFFDLGGHSLLLARLIEGIHSAIGRRLAIVDVFRYPSIRLLSDFLGCATVSSEEQVAPADQRKVLARRQKERRTRTIIESSTSASD